MSVGIHKFRKHTKRGQIMAKAAGLRMKDPKFIKRATLAKKRKQAEVRELLLTPMAKEPAARRTYKRKPKPVLQHAANHQMRYCPNCACNLEAVSLALSFAAGAR